MKWALLAAIIFLCWVALFVTLPRHALLEVDDAVQRSFDTISIAIRRMGARARAVGVGADGT